MHNSRKRCNSTAEDIENKHIQFPMPHAPCPIPNSQLNSNIEAIAPESMQHSEVS
ncbi:hypothetical protein GNF10_21770 [Nostoc sp. UCD121]|uniref:hypothetical protein n=1 Tax=Nostoc sp. UCD120 TaxID=2681312 RepID=UPI001623A4B4|nr:hypothetical protein [Nostoc sp. UCD120]MBC1278521.1 hypothetical protein [Nostoc sp. UCD121]MBC1294271.1 hypothetical protein [Nostoc sp. UCD122]